MNLLVDVKEVIENIQKNGYFILKNSITLDLAESARTEYFQSFSNFALSTNNFKYSQLLLSPIRKKKISSTNSLGEAYPQVMETTFYPKHHRYLAIEKMFNVIVELRNEITGMPADYGDEPERDKFWNARRIHHYPRGGGFMVMHKDTYFSKFAGFRKSPSSN